MNLRNLSIYAMCLLVLLGLGSQDMMAQSMNVEDWMTINKKKPIRINGSVSSSGTYYYSDVSSALRDPFTYQITGSLNLSLYEVIDMPVSFNINNYNHGITYPTMPNRLSLHPHYKCVTAHIGDVSMSFSPYTMNGHQFTGFGAEVSPGKWQFAFMVGRLLKHVEYDPSLPSVTPALGRWGHGAKVRYNGEGFYIGGSMFAASDQKKNSTFTSDSLGILPKSNIAYSVEGGLSLLKNLNFSFEYGVSMMRRDVREEEGTSTYNAVKANIDYTFLHNNIGVGYERICPGYESLGAYYFNNDYENITLNYARQMFGDKLNLALSGGFQRDNLDDEKSERNTRLVGSANISFAPSERVNASVSASTFQGHKNIKSQFDYINAETPYDNLDTLAYTQISNTIDASVNIVTKKSDNRMDNMALSASYQEAADRQGRYILPGNLTRYFNGSLSYGMSFVPQKLTLNAGFAFSDSYSNRTDMITYGPMASVSVRFLKDKLTAGTSFSANATTTAGNVTAKVMNARLNANYRFLKKHCVTASVSWQRKDLASQPDTQNSLTSIMSYSYSF